MDEPLITPEDAFIFADALGAIAIVVLLAAVVFGLPLFWS